MKTLIKCSCFVSFLLSFAISIISPSYAAMNDYCIVPPFVIAGVKPNLLLMVDNSASMYDLSYIDKGRYTGTCIGGSACSNTQSCPVGETCNNMIFTRTPYYCYDQTYTFGLHYAGYFQDWYHYYEYDFTNNYFYEVSTFPASCDKYISGTLCVNGDNLTTTSTPKTVTRFVAEGNYLNWLSASKFDIEKKILTGGKYSTSDNNLMEETRGCVGRKFIKEPITTQSFQEYTPPTPNPNTGLGLTFAVKGPPHPYSETLLSPGGQTYLEIYFGDYQQVPCQTAVDHITSDPPANFNTIRTDIAACLNYSTGKYCSLDQTLSCQQDSDCYNSSWTCTVVHDGVCTVQPNGDCEITAPGVCTANDGNCSHKVCVGGGVAGKSCNNDKDCKYSSCTAGKVGSICNVNSDCDLKTCTAGRIGNACVVDTDCNSGACTDGKVGNACTTNVECDSGSGTCSSGPKIGGICSTSADCGYGYCQQPVTQQIKSTFGQSINECTQYWDTGSFSGTNYLEIVKNPAGCSQIYAYYWICNGGARDGKACSTSADCTGGGTCVNGPQAIRQGNPALICSAAYAGYCASSLNNWATTDWYAREFASADDCITQKFKEFCTGAQVPPVTDPTDDPSSTENFDNLPAIIGDMGIGAQLGDPIKTLTVNLHTTIVPSGLIQEFENVIHFGAMDFNFFGSATECPGNVPCNKICQTSLTSCMVNADCPSGDSCVLAANSDGAYIISYIEGKCSVTTTTLCTNNTQCPAGETCVFSVGDHNSGLINSIDNIFASTWTPFAEGFYDAIGYFARTNPYTDSIGISRTDLRINTTDFNENKNPSQYKCQKNHVLLVTDGMSTTDLNPNVNSLVSLYNDGDGQIDSVPSTCPKYAGSRNIDDLAWVAKNRNIKTFSTSSASTTAPANASETIITYVVYNGAPSNDPGECNPEALMQQTATNGGGLYQRAESYDALRNALRTAFLTIAARASSGTAASVLASGEGSGANLIQAIFYPKRTFGSTQIDWTGSLQNYWYYIDPLLNNSTIREDTGTTDILDLRSDYIMHFYFDTDQQTKVQLFADANGDGSADSSTPTSIKCLDETLAGTPACPTSRLNYIWEAGKLLFTKPVADRNIYTSTDGKASGMITFPSTISTGSPLISLMQAANADEATAIARYVRGSDVKICDNATQTGNKNICNTVADCTGAGETCNAYRNRTVTFGGVTNTWKLGDIVSSTPKTASWIPAGTYHLVYNDSTYGPPGENPKLTDPADSTHFITTADYKNRGAVFVGANDGMLHAFRLGTIHLYEDKYQKASMSGTGTLGDELWAYIPKNALPYLKYTADPTYCHLYYIDSTPSLFDVSIGGSPDADKTASSWKTVLIGGMRYGGSCGAAPSTYKVGPPAPGIGYSSYFALDVTDTLAHPEDPAGHPPVVLWEFSDENIPGELASGGLGFSTTGPALIRTGPKDKNGNWYVVFASGPTGPIDTATHQFKGYSDQPLKLFIVDLKNGPTAGNLWVLNTTIQNAFAGSLIGSPIDLDQNNPSGPGFYQDDAMYFGYTYAEENPITSNTRWTKGGVIRLVTKESTDPSQWTWGKLIDNIGPVTASVSKLQNYKAGYEALWTFFGTGRYFYKIAELIDDADSQRRLYGIKDPCFNNDTANYPNKLDPVCVDSSSSSASVSEGSLGNATNAGLSSSGNWKIDLDTCTDSAGNPVSPCTDPSVVFKTERLITAPTATPIGAVFFTTVTPSADVCEFGGVSHLWAVNYSSGGSVKKGLLKGVALVQVSTGSIEEKKLSEVFTEKPDANTGEGRRTQAIPGQTTEGGALIPVPPKPMNRILHIRER